MFYSHPIKQKHPNVIPYAFMYALWPSYTQKHPNVIPMFAQRFALFLSSFRSAPPALPSKRHERCTNFATNQP